MHALEMTDMDGDGVKDIVTGSRIGTHGAAGSGVFWIGLRRQGATVNFIPHVMDTVSGIGVQLAVGDIGNDGRPGLLVVNKYGIFAYQRSDVSTQVRMKNPDRLSSGHGKNHPGRDGLGRVSKPSKNGTGMRKANGLIEASKEP